MSEPIDLDELERIGNAAILNYPIPVDLTPHRAVNQFIATATRNWQSMVDGLREAERLRSELAQLRADAERWRWVREHGIWKLPVAASGSDYDSAVDAARQLEKT